LGKHASITPAKCVTCHDPHGSGNKNILLANFHSPFEEGECETCHNSDISVNDLRSKDLCLDCHDPEPSEAHSEEILSKKTCIDCHSPHVSDSDLLLKQSYLAG